MAVGIVVVVIFVLGLEDWKSVITDFSIQLKESKSSESDFFSPCDDGLAVYGRSDKVEEGWRLEKVRN